MAEKSTPKPEKRIVWAGDHLYGIKAGSRLEVDPEMADFLVENGHATLPKSQQ